MQLSVRGKQLDVGDALRAHVSDSLARILGKYFGDALDVGVTLSREGNRHRAAVAVHIGRGIQIQAKGDADSPYPAFDTAAEHLAKRLRRYKRRLRDHHQKTDAAHAPMPARQYVLAAQAESDGAESDGAESDGAESDGAESDGAEAEEAAADGDAAPVVVAEMTTEISSLTVSEAVMHMDLGELPALMFRNDSHGGLNMIYRRSDGNIGWIDPRGNLGQ